MPAPPDPPALNPYATPGTVETTAAGEGLLLSALPACSVVIPPGHRLVSGLGSVRGRARGFRGFVLTGLWGLVSGRGYARWRADLRRLAFQRMLQQAEGHKDPADALVGVNFQTHDTIFGVTIATCTAVTVKIAPIPGLDIPAAAADPAGLDRLRESGRVTASADGDVAIPAWRVGRDETLPGFRVVAVVGLVHAGAVRWNPRGQRDTGVLRSGGESADALQEDGPVAAARARLLADAAAAGANGVIGLRATLHVIAPGITEAVCVGTAVAVTIDHQEHETGAPAP